MNAGKRAIGCLGCLGMIILLIFLGVFLAKQSQDVPIVIMPSPTATSTVHLPGIWGIRHHDDD